MVARIRPFRAGGMCRERAFRHQHDSNFFGDCGVGRNSVSFTIGGERAVEVAVRFEQIAEPASACDSSFRAAPASGAAAKRTRAAASCLRLAQPVVTVVRVLPSYGLLDLVIAAAPLYSLIP
jgi:hypothetical protein